ncbi:MAG: helix-turn-helix transcriptional regulator [Clostridiales bacterium]|nr:helix-turn-helix transcriptional regulator [Clostridiales bacterium]
MNLNIDRETRNIVYEYMPKQSTLSELAEFFSSFSDVTRAKIICALSISEMCVGDLAAILNLNQTTCSHQLRYLKEKDIVQDRRVGKMIYYSIKNQKVADVLLMGAECMGMIPA